MSAQAREMVFESPFGRRGQPQEPRFKPRTWGTLRLSMRPNDVAGVHDALFGY